MTSSHGDKHNRIDIDELTEKVKSIELGSTESIESPESITDTKDVEAYESAANNEVLELAENIENTDLNVQNTEGSRHHTGHDDIDRPTDYAIPAVKKSHTKGSEKSRAERDLSDADDYIFARYHGKRSHSYYNAGNDKDAKSSHRSKHRRHRSHTKKKFKTRPVRQKILIILGWILAGLAALLLIAILVLFILHRIGYLQLTDYSDLDMTAPTVANMNVSVNDSGRTVTYNGKTYVFNNDVTSVLCIGVDKNEFGLEDDRVGTAGQCDALYLVALNTATGKTKIIGISRDIVTDIGIYTEDGEYLHTEKLQLCLAYAYGNGTTTSCLNTVTAVSRLFYQLPINSYFAINLDTICTLNDAIGGVTVTMKDDLFVDAYNVRHYTGETVTLYGKSAMNYVRSRNLYELESSYNRMQHQINYLDSFTRDTISKTKKDLMTPINLYNIISDNCVTNLNPSRITTFATCIVGNGISELEFTQVPGTITTDGTYARYIVDEQGLYEIILDTFYTVKAD